MTPETILWPVPGQPLIFTIGHSTRSIEEFIHLLHGAQVRRLVDVRSIPRSRTNPSYNIDVLPEILATYRIAHSLIPELGGRRPRQKEIASEVNGFWENQSFHNYADYAMSTEYHEGLAKLAILGLKETCAIMCSEALWWRCHRRIITDYLLFAGWSVVHLMGGEQRIPARATDTAVRKGDIVVYPRRDRIQSP